MPRLAEVSIGCHGLDEVAHAFDLRGRLRTLRASARSSVGWNKSQISAEVLRSVESGLIAQLMVTPMKIRWVMRARSMAGMSRLISPRSCASRKICARKIG